MTNVHSPGCRITRRSLLTGAGVAIGSALLPRTGRAAEAPAAPVALARSMSYGT